MIVAAITDAANKKRIYPSHIRVPLGAGGLTMDSIVLCEQIRAISKTRLRRQLGRFDKSTISRLDAALKITLDLA
ncbi:MAG TPA: type II toxin-antitoxin system PemK/MazF family toxin [Terriglobales bacterium]|nr:type II toxin-antitoxin system PemK/MazF family toxin [Terriglobales bacterium]